MALEDDIHRHSGVEASAGKTDEPAGFDAIYRSEVPSLVRFFRRRLGSYDEADDLAQEALTRFLRASPVTQIATPQAYLRRIATNLLRDRAERASTRLAELSVPLVEGLDHPTEYDQHRELEGRQELEHYGTILRQLKPKTLEIFLLSRVDGFTYKEIASRVGMSVWGVKRQMLKAIAHIDQHRRNR
ncbi:sigma-70 family RNA polymerase sigma factor [Sphingobium fuliginis]|jgi:RNA polymerase sigma-70 factor (ECF subfamily)|uniref:Sigma-70 family RNA polymerase sigma factor n=1 Tax=Sphingobium fuliginis (strain ATCC 27551) TaxID=336203 RepID=A0A7M2GJK1_SPHSA|nr:sigma-70 family RNA polymerase sigma factor [Sphingobium fuliginis]QOT72272.1 sigma-70 family RNA polymerase sigma factor [Sphingobium fuliginis]